MPLLTWGVRSSELAFPAGLGIRSNGRPYSPIVPSYGSTRPSSAISTPSLPESRPLFEARTRPALLLVLRIIQLKYNPQISRFWSNLPNELLLPSKHLIFFVDSPHSLASRAYSLGPFDWLWKGFILHTGILQHICPISAGACIAVLQMLPKMVRSEEYCAWQGIVQPDVGRSATQNFPT